MQSTRAPETARQETRFTRHFAQENLYLPISDVSKLGLRKARQFTSEHHQRFLLLLGLLFCF